MRAALALACSLTLGACGAPAPSDAGNVEPQAGGATDSANQPQPDGTNSLNLGDPRKPSGSGLSEGEACATYTAQAKSTPAILQLVVDISASMAWPPDFKPRTPDEQPPVGSPSKWDATRSALLRAVDALPAQAALGAYFYPGVRPNDERDQNLCIRYTGALPITALGARESATRTQFVETLRAIEPAGATPTHAAYSFGIEKLTTTPLVGNKFILLLTDGVPTLTKECAGDGSTEVDSTPLIQEVGKAQAAGMRTFVIGSPGSEEARDTLSQMARNGGTARAGCSDLGPNYCHFDMTANTENLSTALTQVLNSITGSIVACDYEIPAPPAGEVLDPGRVNVIYTTGNGDVLTIPATQRDDCNDGWHYSDGGTRIEICGAACDRIKADRRARIDIQFGCATKILDPK